MPARPSTDQLAQTLLPHVERRVGDSPRFLLGLAGPPGAGKSALADALRAAFERAQGVDTAVVVGMDGFHLRQDELERRQLDHVKGAPETFDADGFVGLLRNLRRAHQTVAAPRFDRAIEEPVEAAIVVTPSHRLVVVEGNYLLFDGRWAPVRTLVDETWHLYVPDSARIPLLIDRHVAFGRTPSEATNWVMRSDEANARLVTAVAHRADAILDTSTGHFTETTASKRSRGNPSA